MQFPMKAIKEHESHENTPLPEKLFSCLMDAVELHMNMVFPPHDYNLPYTVCQETPLLKMCP